MSSQHVKVKEWKPKSTDSSEVIWHCSTYSWVNHISMKPRPKKWGVDPSTAWLNDHPIDWQNDEIGESHDVEFVVGKMKRRKDQLENVCAALVEQNAALEGRWTGKVPMLRSIHCLIEDGAIKSAFIRCHNSKDRIQLDNRNSMEKRDPTVWELMSLKWNDCEFNLKTMILNIEGQTEFLDEISLDYPSVQHFAAATPGKCETKFDEMMVTSKRIIQKWEASGQGEGGVNDEVEEEEGLELNVRHELGSLRYRSHDALASRPNFFQYCEMYLLYFWGVCACCWNEGCLAGSNEGHCRVGVLCCEGAAPMPGVGILDAAGGDCRDRAVQRA